MDSLALFKDTTITIVSGTAAYSLPTDFMFEKLVKHKEIKLDPISRSTLLYYKNRDWTIDSGTPRFYCIDPEESRKQILVYPNPGDGDTGANLVMTYYPFPTALVATGDIPLNSSLLMVQFHIGIAAYAAFLLSSYDMSPSNEQNKRDLMKMYLDKVTEARDKFGNTASEQWRLRGGRYWR